MILLYTGGEPVAAVWLLKGFIDEIPREYEEAALIDGYTRFQAFRRSCCRRRRPASPRPRSSA
jgi:multiple sugar transport system permease protein